MMMQFSLYKDIQ